MSKSNMLKNFKKEIGPKSWENMAAYDPRGYIPSFDWAGKVPTLQDVQKSIKRSHAVLKLCANSRTIEDGWGTEATQLDAKVVSVGSAVTEKSDMKLFGFYAYQFERWAWRILGHETEEVIAAVKEKHYKYMETAVRVDPAPRVSVEEQVQLLADMVTQLTTEVAELRKELEALKQKPKRSRKAKAEAPAEASAE